MIFCVFDSPLSSLRSFLFARGNVRAAAFAISLGLAASPTLAQQNDLSVEPRVKVAPSQEQKVEEPAKAVKPAPTVEFPKDLDGLFSQLKRTRDKQMAERISQRIWEIWQTSDSKSVDLLTRWARVASGSQRYAKAMDLLDQVIVLRPDYAEGFNQRATLHFMMQNFGKSIADIERTLALEPRHYGALAGLASILEKLQRKEEALETWYRALNVYPAMESAQAAVLRLEEELAGRGI